MYALIYDEYNPDVPQKRIISTHRTREEAEVALDRRRQKLGRRVWQCSTRIVWVREDRFHEGDSITTVDFETWSPNDRSPEGEYDTGTE